MSEFVAKTDLKAALDQQTLRIALLLAVMVSLTVVILALI